MKKVLEAIQEALAALKECKATGPRAEAIESHLKACESNAAAAVGEEPQAEKPKGNKKEGGFTLLGLMIVVAIVALVAVCALSARAAATYQSFGATNYLAGNTTIASFPTNTPGTNGLNQLTGKGVYVGGSERCSFVYRGEPVGSNTTNNMVVTLIRGYGDSAPGMAVNTNGSFTAWPLWETLPTLTLTIPQNGTNTTTWSTNLDSYLQGGVGWVGIWSIQNAYTSTANTNFDVGIGKKSIPITYP